jgi:hypothetical protein
MKFNFLIMIFLNVFSLYVYGAKPETKQEIDNRVHLMISNKTIADLAKKLDEQKIDDAKELIEELDDDYGITMAEREVTSRIDKLQRKDHGSSLEQVTKGDIIELMSVKNFIAQQRRAREKKLEKLKNENQSSCIIQ